MEAGRKGPDGLPDVTVALGGPLGDIGPLWRLAAQERHVLVIASSESRARMLRRLLERWGVRVTIRSAEAGQLLIRALMFDGVEILAGASVGPEALAPEVLRAEAIRAGFRLAGRWLKAPQSASSLARVGLGGLSFDLETGMLADGHGPVRLTALEAHLLRVLAQNAYTAVPKAALRPDIEKGRSVDIAIMRLRRRIEPNSAEPVYLQTVRCRGYMLKPDRLEHGV